MASFAGISQCGRDGGDAVDRSSSLDPLHPTAPSPSFDLSLSLSHSALPPTMMSYLLQWVTTYFPNMDGTAPALSLLLEQLTTTVTITVAINPNPADGWTQENWTISVLVKLLLSD